MVLADTAHAGPLTASPSLARHPEPIQRSVRRRPRRFVAAFCYLASASLHAAIILAPLTLRPRSDFGAVADFSEAISVELAASDVIDSADLSTKSTASQSSVAAAEGATREDKAAEAPTLLQPVAPRELRTAASDDPAAAVTPPVARTVSEASVAHTDAPDPPAVKALDAIAGSADGESAASPSQPTPERASPAAHVQQQSPPARSTLQPRDKFQHVRMSQATSRADRKASAEKPAGGKPSSASQGKQGSSGRVSASQGDIIGYAARVRARVASRRPAGAGARGSVVVSFSVTRSGGLGFARIASSSGNRSLDSAALNAVRSAAPFPPPPGGAGPLNFSVPFHYQ